MTVTPGTPAADLAERDRAAIEAAIARVIAGPVLGLPVTLRRPIEYALSAGGKRLRPALCVATWRAVRAGAARVPDAVYDAACAIELIHTYSLVHDDLPCMDDDDLRRGRPTLHRVFSEQTATVAGATLIPLAMSVLDSAAVRLSLDVVVRRQLVRELSNAAGAQGMVGGQVLDLEAEGHMLDGASLEDVHRRKTGAMFAASLRLGGMLARPNDTVLEALGRAGSALGLAFQVTDDVLDETGSAAVLGKSAGRDRERGKTTFATLLGVDGARERAAEAVAASLSTLHGAGIADEALESLIRLAADRDR